MISTGKCSPLWWSCPLRGEVSESERGAEVSRWFKIGIGQLVRPAWTLMFVQFHSIFLHTNQMTDPHQYSLFVCRFLLKSLLQYQSLSEGEILPMPSSSSHPPVPPVALTSGPAGASGLSVGHNLVSMVSTGEDGPLKKPKKERKERGRENGKEERECWNKIILDEVKGEIRFTFHNGWALILFYFLVIVQFQRRCPRRESWLTGLGSWCSPYLWTHLVVPSSPSY